MFRMLLLYDFNAAGYRKLPAAPAKNIILNRECLEP
jgi:hypothetical protein